MKQSNKNIKYDEPNIVISNTSKRITLFELKKSFIKLQWSVSINTVNTKVRHKPWNSFIYYINSIWDVDYYLYYKDIKYNPRIDNNNCQVKPLSIYFIIKFERSGWVLLFIKLKFTWVAKASINNFNTENNITEHFHCSSLCCRGDHNYLLSLA